MRVPEQPPEPRALGDAHATGRLAKPVPLTRRGQTLLKGHSLFGEGAPVNTVGRPVNRYGGVGGYGHGMCECGAISIDVLSSSKARRAWHADHKDSLR